MRKTLQTYVAENYIVYDKSVKYNDTKPPALVLGRAWSGLLLLTQATNKSHSITTTIVDLARTIDPIMDNIGCYAREKFNVLLDYEHRLHNRHYEENEFVNRIVASYPPLDYILHWYNEADFETPFDLNQYSIYLGKLKEMVIINFNKSIWAS